MEKLPRAQQPLELGAVPKMSELNYNSENPNNLTNAMRRYAAMLDTLRDGLTKKERADIPESLTDRSQHVKSFGYFQDASQMGVCQLHANMHLPEPISNSDVQTLSETLKQSQTNTLASGIDVVMAEIKSSMSTPPQAIQHHTHAVVFLYEYPRDPEQDEIGCNWLHDCQAPRASIRAAETAAVLSNYIRLLGHDARGHTLSASDVDLNKLAVAAGLAQVHQNQVINPFLGTRFGIGAVTTTLALEPDRMLSSLPSDSLNQARSKKIAKYEALYQKRAFKDGLFPFEKIKRKKEPTTLIDEQRVPRVPKRTDMFARALFGDLGSKVQQATRNGNYVRKSPASYAHRTALAAFVILQDTANEPASNKVIDEPQHNADHIKAALYFLGADAVGISRCPDWSYYSHDASGKEITPYHRNAISVIIDQGHETMEGASGDDWIACAQSMRAYLRFSLLGGIIADQIRALGYSAKAHTVMDGEVLQPPLLLLSGLGEVSRIGEVILNPYLGPRLKSGVITTDMPLAHDQPIDFGLQNFCNNCNKCARECPSGAITAGPKVMFNGYEIWKSDSQKCTTYRVSQLGGAMCGRCMKTCPWNLEGLFSEAPFRWVASNLPFAAKPLAKLDDMLGRGRINPIKKWWWDLEMVNDGPYKLAQNTPNKREIQPQLKLDPKDQTLAVYPANLAPPPYPFPFLMNRESGIEAYNQLLSPKEYRQRLTQGKKQGLAHQYTSPTEDSPVLALNISHVERMTDDTSKYELSLPDGSELPPFKAGAHIDVVIAPEYFRQYSLSGDPQKSHCYQIAVKRESPGSGGSQLLHKIFLPNRRVFVSRPINHFPLNEKASHTWLMAGGIGVTPLIAMAHRLHRIKKPFELHYSCRSRADTAFFDDLSSFAWRNHVSFHFSDDSTRLEPDQVIAEYQPGFQLYTCGSDRYMQAVNASAQDKGWPEECIHQEYFSTPDIPEYENHPFTIELALSGQSIEVGAEQSAADALIEAGVPIHVKCSDGLCGTCKCGVIYGEIEHRDFVLSKEQRKTQMITCQSRSSRSGGKIRLDL